MRLLDDLFGDRASRIQRHDDVRATSLKWTVAGNSGGAIAVHGLIGATVARSPTGPYPRIFSSRCFFPLGLGAGLIAHAAKFGASTTIQRLDLRAALQRAGVETSTDELVERLKSFWRDELWATLALLVFCLGGTSFGLWIRHSLAK